MREGVPKIQNVPNFKFFPIRSEGGSSILKLFPNSRNSRKLWTFSTFCDIFLWLPLGLARKAIMANKTKSCSYICWMIKSALDPTRMKVQYCTMQTTPSSNQPSTLLVLKTQKIFSYARESENSQSITLAQYFTYIENKLC